MSYVKFLVVIVVLGAGGSAASPPDGRSHEPAAYAVTLTVGDITIASHDGFITIRPSTGDSSHGLQCRRGMRVSPEAVNTRVAAEPAVRIQIAIGRLLMNLDVF
jgi:hypothetical protein